MLERGANTCLRGHFTGVYVLVAMLDLAYSLPAPFGPTAGCSFTRYLKEDGAPKDDDAAVTNENWETTELRRDFPRWVCEKEEW
jgi:hypothetical protein